MRIQRLLEHPHDLLVQGAAVLLRPLLDALLQRARQSDAEGNDLFIVHSFAWHTTIVRMNCFGANWFILQKEEDL